MARPGYTKEIGSDSPMRDSSFLAIMGIITRHHLLLVRHQGMSIIISYCVDINTWRPPWSIREAKFLRFTLRLNQKKRVFQGMYWKVKKLTSNLQVII